MSAETEKDLDRGGWLAQGSTLAGEVEVEGLTPAALCARAGGSAASLEKEFPDFRQYLTELMMLGMDRTRSAVVQSTGERPPGIERLLDGLRAWLDANLAHSWVRGLMLELAADEDAVELVRRRVHGFVLMLQLEFQGIGWPRAQASARLCTAALVELSVAEYEARRVLPAMRDTLFTYLARR